MKTLDHLLVKKALAISISMALAVSPPLSMASGAVAGATEYTQLGSWVQNFKNFATQMQNLTQQLQTIRNQLDIAKQMREQLSSVTGLVRDGQEMFRTLEEIKNMGRDVERAFGSLDQLKDLSAKRFLEISRYKDQFGNSRSVEDYFVESMRENGREHQMNQVLRDQEVAAMKRLESAGKAIEEHAKKIPGAVGVNQAVSLMSTQINNLAAMTADINKITVARAAKQTDKEDRDAAIAKRNLERVNEENKKTDDLIRSMKSKF